MSLNIILTPKTLSITYDTLDTREGILLSYYQLLLYYPQTSQVPKLNPPPNPLGPGPIGGEIPPRAEATQQPSNPAT